MLTVRPVFAKTARKDASKRTSAETGSIEKLCIKPAPSKMLDQLATMSSVIEITPIAAVNRTKGFNETPHLQVDKPSGSIRDERLALIEDLEPGPYDHKPPSDDPAFDKLEPHSGINLLSVQYYFQCVTRNLSTVSDHVKFRMKTFKTTFGLATIYRHHAFTLQFDYSQTSKATMFLFQETG
jgi:hypothetical protein